MGVQADSAVAFEATLREVLETLPGDIELSVRVGAIWIVRRPTCLCSEFQTCPTRRQVRPAGAPGPVSLCGAPGLGETLVAAAARIHERNEERRGLFDELAQSYESLSSIFEIGSDPTLLVNPQKALARIVERALAYEPGMRAAVWLLEGERLVPAQWHHARPPRPRLAGTGLIGRAIQQNRGIILNHPAQADREQRGARRMAVAPLQTRDRPLGALVVWHEQPGSFDSLLMGLLTSLANQAAMILEQDRLRQETIEGERLRHEVEISGDIQQSLLLGTAPQDLNGARIGWVAEASQRIDGDFFGFFRHADGVFDLLVGDVMGKGISAALVGAAVKSQFVRFASTQLASGKSIEPAQPAEIVSAVHGEVGAQLIGLGRFVTATYARFDLDAGTMTYVDCGHTDTLHYRADQQRVRAISADPRGHVNLPLGFLPDTTYVQSSVPFQPGDTLLFYSDGITEAIDPQGAMFGVEALSASLSRLHHRNAQALVASIRDEVKAFASSERFHDDLTCLAVQIQPPESAPLELEIDATSGQLAQVRAFVAEVCAAIPGRPFDEDARASLQLALTEAASNVVRHAYAEKGEQGSLRIGASWTRERVRFLLTDRGSRSMESERIPAPTFDGSLANGFGVFMIRKIMSTVAYTRDEDGTNRVELTRTFGHED